mmetsp:Transcript_3648/g.3767  ORF Transcript_3648/g.3767 Transcript_3648/m.3767 type:complete len:199 (+) Transcript_3648:56-652(+)|eukprot:CAMPEP_0182418934 /NCGR_PEP_ID=MMETSP1167-20130531/3319_1 /TAXON_ID=2988 /ORGANISM="Mallomonas Sp, Strain CCMP3275" /LENGTH=198 /DNA_ID=CAMNT_0024593431 /DNA_START=55 /DNA_END=651 /DNA_ORIENTATION=+
MIRAAVVLASILSAAAFSPARVNTRSNALRMGFESEPGVLPPTGFWDPLGLSADGDVEVFQRRQATELKHGRVAQLAVFGYLFQEYFRLPGTVDFVHKFSDFPNGIAAVGAIPSFGWAQIVASIGYWELIGWEDNATGVPGDFGFGKGVYDGFSDEQKLDIKNREINNGRIAMIAIMELLTHDVAKPAGEGLFVLHHF